MYASFAAVQAAMDQGHSVVAITKSYLLRIRTEHHLNAFLEVFEEEALTAAAHIDEKVKNGTAGRLAGMVIGLKDNIVYKGHRAAAASKMLEGFTSLYSATVVERLQAEDAIIIGRLNCDEFAMGSSNEYSAYGAVSHPRNEKVVPGGSSGGSAAAVAAHLCTAALGSDTGGSIRQPASFTGTVGLKPTYGRVSRHGLIAYASSFDQIGPLTNTVEDAALLLEVMSGKDDFDSTLSQEPTADFTSDLTPFPPSKIAYIKECVEHEGIDPEIKDRFLAIVDQLKRKGHLVEAVSFPYLDVMVPTYQVLTAAEASSNLARYDGIHYGHQSTRARGVEETYKQSRSEGFGEEVQRRLLLGTFVLSHEYHDAYYTKGQKIRRLIQDKTHELLKKYAVILSPTTPTTAFEKGKNVNNPIVMYLQDVFTVHANLAGNPSISLPLGEHSNGLPFGIQVMGRHFEERTLLGCACEVTTLAKDST